LDTWNWVAITGAAKEIVTIVEERDEVTRADHPPQLALAWPDRDAV
jgi:hypothetical protein